MSAFLLGRCRSLLGFCFFLNLGLTVVMGAGNEQVGLPLHASRESPFDLALTGRLAGVPAGETRFARWENLRVLPTSKIKLEGEFLKGEQEVTVIFLSDLLGALKLGPGVDTVLATCTDGYASVYEVSTMEAHRPFVILEINGKGPSEWPPPGIQYNPGPYVIFISSTVAPDAASLLDVGHKRPWGVTTIELANYNEKFAGIQRGRWAGLSAKAAEGREIWVHSCTSCHKGPGGSFGGSKSDRPFEVLAAHAGFNQAYFKRYVLDPQAVLPGAKMQGHPHYNDAQLEALIAFIIAEQKP